MQLLLQPQHRRPWTVGTTASTVLHAALVLLVVLAHQPRAEAPTFGEQFVTFLVPPDKVAGPDADAKQAQAGWQGGGGVGAGEVPQTSPTGTGPLVEAEAEVTDSAGVPPAPDPVAELLAETSVLTELEVDSAVRRHPESAAPAYPPSMLERNQEGSVFVAFVVDTTGHVDTSTFRIIRATHPAFIAAVRDVLPRMRFRPALLDGTPVPQLVQQPFTFRIRPADTPAQNARRRPPGA